MQKQITHYSVFDISTCYIYRYLWIAEEIYGYLPEILSCQFWKILKKSFLVTGGRWYAITEWLYGHSFQQEIKNYLAVIFRKSEKESKLLENVS